MNKNKKFEAFLESLKGNGQDQLIESVKQGFQVCFEANLNDMLEKIKDEWGEENLNRAIEKIGKKKFLHSKEKYVKKIAELLQLNPTINRAKDGDFEALAHKPLKTALKSNKLEPMRSWEKALEEYLK